MKEEILKLVKAAAEGNQEAQQQIEQIMQAAQQPGADSKLVQIAQYIMQLLQPESAKKGCKTKKKPLIPTKKCGKKVEKGSLGISSKLCKCVLKKVGGTIVEVDSCTGLPYMKKGKVLKAKVRKGDGGLDTNFMANQNALSDQIASFGQQGVDKSQLGLGGYRSPLLNNTSTSATPAGATPTTTGTTPTVNGNTTSTKESVSPSTMNTRSAAPINGISSKNDIAQKLGSNMTGTMKNLLSGVSDNFDFRSHWMGTPVSAGSSLKSINNASSGVNKALSLFQKLPTQPSQITTQAEEEIGSNVSQVNPANTPDPSNTLQNESQGATAQDNTNMTDPTAKIADRNARKLARQNARQERRLNRIQNKTALNEAKTAAKQAKIANKFAVNDAVFNMKQEKMSNNQVLKEQAHSNRMTNIANSAEARAERRNNVQAGLNDWREHSQSAMADRRENRQAAQLDRLKHKKEINDFKSTM